MNLSTFVSKFVQVVRKDGLLKSLRSRVTYFLTRKSAPSDNFDLVRGTDTSGKISVWDKTNSPNAKYGVHYQATGEGFLREVVKIIGINPAEWTFLDLGCGKGRILIEASELGFPRVIGVEFVPELARIASSNLRITKFDQALVIIGDAAEAKFPDEDFVLYLHNPFSVEVMRKVVTNLQKVHARYHVIYLGFDRKCEKLFNSSYFLKRYPSESISLLDVNGNAGVWSSI